MATEQHLSFGTVSGDDSSSSHDDYDHIDMIAYQVPVFIAKPSWLHGMCRGSAGVMCQAVSDLTPKTSAGSSEQKIKEKVSKHQIQEGKNGPANFKVARSPYITLGRGDANKTITQSSQSISLPTSEQNTPNVKPRANLYKMAMLAFEGQIGKNAMDGVIHKKFKVPRYPKLDKRPSLPFPLIQLIPVPE